MIKVSDFIAEFLFSKGIRHVYMLTGGGAMHLNDSLGRHAGFVKVFNHHEQASAMAAESHARLTGELPVINVTTGPGGINTLNGVFGAWTDSIPMFVLSGQVRFDTTVQASGLNLRQLGDQECEIIRCVMPITKYAVTVADPLQIKYELEKALYIAKEGRPGPVWVDVPMNVQGAMIDPAQLPSFDASYFYPRIPNISPATIQSVLTKLLSAKRPVIIAGGGVRISGAHDLFLRLIDKLQIPVTTAWNAHDVLHDDHTCYVGRPGTVGDRAGNFAVQNADLLLVLGSRLNIRQIGYNYSAFARNAFKIMVDIDALEMIKPTLTIDMPVHGSLKDFLTKMLILLDNQVIPENKEWMAWCHARRARYPVVQKAYWDITDAVNPYCFMQALSDYLPEEQIIVTGDGTACVTSFQAMVLKKGQRLYTNSGSASMGYDLPAAIGACVASGMKRVICIAGDGSIQQNIQELATIAHNAYPIKIFVLNNNGYHSIRQTQKNFFGEPLVGVGPDSGLGFPSFAKLADAYGLSYVRCQNHAEMREILRQFLATDVPAICEVMLTLEQQFAPKSSSKRLADGRMVSRPLEDLAPFLSREELAENMIVAMDDDLYV